MEAKVSSPMAKGWFKYDFFSLIRRRRNLTETLKLHDGNWIGCRDNIGEQFINFYTELFSCSKTSIPDWIETILPPIVSENDNVQLRQIPSLLEELRWTVFTMSKQCMHGIDATCVDEDQHSQVRENVFYWKLKQIRSQLIIILMIRVWKLRWQMWILIPSN